MNRLIFVFCFYFLLVVVLKGCSHKLDKKEDESGCYRFSTGELWCLDELDE